MLPFSLWRSNALWNLLPADPAVNGKKSDRLAGVQAPRRHEGRGGGVLGDREGERPERFAREAERLAEPSQPGLGVLFGAMVEAVEVMAMQRGAERWAG